MVSLDLRTMYAVPFCFPLPTLLLPKQGCCTFRAGNNVPRFPPRHTPDIHSILHAQ